MDTPRERILQRLKSALATKNPIPHPEVERMDNIFEAAPKDMDVLFVQQFQKLGGKFMYCEDTNAVMTNLAQLRQQKGWKTIHCQEPLLRTLMMQYDMGKFLNKDMNPEHIHVGFTSCRALLAHTGSIVMDSQQAWGRTLSILPDIHIILATTRQLVYHLESILTPAQQHELPSMLTIITGASRTADIEKTLVMGAHGPKELYLFLLDT